MNINNLMNPIFVVQVLQNDVWCHWASAPTLPAALKLEIAALLGAWDARIVRVAS